MFLSIIIPIYNDEKYLEECLDSCLNQDIPNNDYEIICVDDGSTDSTPTILKRYNKDFPNVIVIAKEHGKGSGRNVGMKQASGEYLWFVDHDDFIQRNCLSMLRSSIQQTKYDRVVFPVYSFWEEFSESEQKKFDLGVLEPNYKYLDSVVWSSIIRHEFLLEHDVWPSPLRARGKPLWSADSFFISEVKYAGARELCLKDNPIYYYRLNRRSETMQATSAVYNKKIEASINIACLARDDYNQDRDQNGLASIYRTSVMMFQTKACMMRIATLPRPFYREGVKKMKVAGIYPMKFPPEYSYSFVRSFSLDKDKTAVQNFLYNHCLLPGGKYLARVSNVKLLLKRAISLIKGKAKK